MAEAVKILLKRGKIYAAPYYHVFDAYLNCYKRGYIWGGTKNPLFQLKCFIIRKKLTKFQNAPQITEQKTYSRPIEKILERTRWAASGENTQNWRFRILDDNRAEIHISTAAIDIFEEYTKNNPSIISLGILLETATIAASALGIAISHEYRLDMVAQEHVVTIECGHGSNIVEDALAPYIEARSVNRFSYQTRQLTAKEKEQLSASLGEDFLLEWYEDLLSKLRIAKLNARALDILLRFSKFFHTFNQRIDWENKFSIDRMPITSIPLSGLTRYVMRFVTKKWSRMNFANNYLAGTLAPQLETSIIPGVRCAAHFFIIARNDKFTTGDPENVIEIGRKLQRFWLTATHLGLSMQPAFATMVFRDLNASTALLSKEKFPINKIKIITKNLSKLRSGKEFSDAHIVFAGRIGTPLSPTITSRSIRKPLEEMLIE
jgi:nitroreductase